MMLCCSPLQVDLQAGLVTTLAGAREPGFLHGHATRDARFRFPQKLALDARRRRLFVSDLNDVVRVIQLGTCYAPVAVPLFPAHDEALTQARRRWSCWLGRRCQAAREARLRVPSFHSRADLRTTPRRTPCSLPTVATTPCEPSVPLQPRATRCQPRRHLAPTICATAQARGPVFLPW